MGRFLIFLISFVAGIFLIFFFDPGSLGSSKISKKTLVGEVVSIEGSANRRSPDTFDFDSLEEKDQISQLDTLSVEAQSVVQIRVVGGTLIELQPQTQVVFDRKAESDIIEVVVLEGKADILQLGTEGEVNLIENQIPLNTKNTVSSRPQTPPGATSHDAVGESQNTVSQAPTPEVMVPRSQTPSPSFQDKSLSRDYIQNVLHEQRRFVQSCFVKYFNQQAGKVQFGTTLIGFVIEPSGKVSQSKVLKSEITDRNYQDCVVSIIARTRFKSFRAAPIDMEYPIQITPP